MTVRILVTGDLHIGRRPSHVPEVELAERTSPARMWEAIVSCAITERVDAVMLSGDIVDHDNRFYEATGPLERGILRLAEADIPTYAVAGNHDWDVFPRILNLLETPQFHFLGQGGHWEETHLERDGKRLLRIVGWSFPARHVRQSPLLEFPYNADPNIPTVGLLHADVDAPTSEYAPVRLPELQSHNLSLWVLGHIHKPEYWSSETGAHVLYPGSPQALSPNETGVHGPWLIELEGSRSVLCRQLPMSLIRYEQREVDLSGIDTPEAFDTRVNEAVFAALKNVVASDRSPELLSLRIRFVGTTPLYGRIDSLARQLSDLKRSHGGVQAQIDQCTNLTRPAIDLDELIRRNDPAGLLARTLIALEQNKINPSLNTLLSDTATCLTNLHVHPTYLALVDHDPVPDREMAREILIRQVQRLLEAICRQHAEPEESTL